MSHLARWLSHRGETPTEFSKRTGLSWASVQRAIHETRRLDLKTGIRMSIGTFAEVPVSAFCPDDGHLVDELVALQTRKSRKRRVAA